MRICEKLNENEWRIREKRAKNTWRNCEKPMEYENV